MPPAARRKVEKVKERYEDDFEVLRTVLVSFQGPAELRPRDDTPYSVQSRT